MSPLDRTRLDRGDVAGLRVCVAGTGRAGASAARVLTAAGAEVVTADRRDGTDQDLPAALDLVVTSPGWRPDQPLLQAAAAAGVPVWGDVELAWRLRRTEAPWLGVTGTNGKTTTVQMLDSMLHAAGHRSVACGNIGLPVLDAVLADEPYDVLAVEVSSFQLHWMRTVRFRAAAVLNIAPDHLDWHGSMTAYASAKAAIWTGCPVPVFNADDPTVARLARGLAGSVGFTTGEPSLGQLGVVDGALVSRSPLCSAPGTGAQRSKLAEVTDVRPAAPHNVANALAAAALACAVEAAPAAVGAGLRAFTPGRHRIEVVATRGGTIYVDDSKATNPHATAASLGAFDRVVWIAGGLAKGAHFDDVVAGAAQRLRAAVLLGQDRALVADALARHAPQIPVVVVERTDTGAMDDVVRAAADLAQPGDTVLLAPACASMDMFRDYAARGDAFAAAVGRLTS